MPARDNVACWICPAWAIRVPVSGWLCPGGTSAERRFGVVFFLVCLSEQAYNAATMPLFDLSLTMDRFCLSHCPWMSTSGSLASRRPNPG